MQSKVTKEAYLEWIKGKKVNKYPKKIEGLDFPFLYEYGVPFMELDVLFYQETLHAGEPLKNLYSEDKYAAGFYRRNSHLLEGYFVIAQDLGNAICLAPDGCIVQIDYLNFLKRFVNSSFEEFIRFWIIVDKALGNQPNEHSVEVSHEKLEKIERELMKCASRDWREYEYWQFKLECMDEDFDLF